MRESIWPSGIADEWLNGQSPRMPATFGYHIQSSKIQTRTRSLCVSLACLRELAHGEVQRRARARDRNERKAERNGRERVRPTEKKKRKERTISDVERAFMEISNHKNL